MVAMMAYLTEPSCQNAEIIKQNANSALSPEAMCPTEVFENQHIKVYSCFYATQQQSKYCTA